MNLQELSGGARYALTGLGIGAAFGTGAQIASDALIKTIYGDLVAEDQSENLINYAIRVTMTGVALVAAERTLVYLKADDVDPTDGFFMVWGLLQSQTKFKVDEGRFYRALANNVDGFLYPPVNEQGSSQQSGALGGSPING